FTRLIVVHSFWSLRRRRRTARRRGILPRLLWSGLKPNARPRREGKRVYNRTFNRTSGPLARLRFALGNGLGPDSGSALGKISPSRPSDLFLLFVSGVLRVEFLVLVIEGLRAESFEFKSAVHLCLSFLAVPALWEQGCAGLCGHTARSRIELFR